MKRKVALTFLSLCAVTFLASCGDREIPRPQPVPQPGQYNITAAFDSCHVNNMPKVIEEDDEVTFTIIPDARHTLPTGSSSDFEITGTDYRYNPSSGEVTLFEPFSDVVVSVKANAIDFDLTCKFVNCSVTKEPPKTIKTDDTVTLEVTPSAGYKLPSEDEISVVNCKYKFSVAETGRSIFIELYNPTGDVSLKVTSIGKTFNFNFSATNCDYKVEDVPNTITYGKPVIIPLKPIEGYKLPADDKIDVTNCTCTYDVDKESYIINLDSSAIGIASVDISATEIRYKVIPKNMHGCTFNPTIVGEEGDRIWIESLQGYNLPSSVNATNCEYQYSIRYAFNAGELILSNVTGDVEVEATGIPIDYDLIVNLVNCKADKEIPTTFNLDTDPIELKLTLDSAGKMPTSIDAHGCDYEYVPNHNLTEATLKIIKPYDKVFINVDASVEATYHYSMPYMYGVDSSTEEGDQILEEPLEIEFTPIEATYGIPEEDNIFIIVDDNNIVNPSKDSEIYHYEMDDGSSSAKLTIDGEKAGIKSNIKIAVRAPNYDLLNKLSWSEISELSIMGLPKLFKIGEEKEVTLKNQTNAHHVRIVDINKDNLSLGVKAGLTFEFKELISDADGNALTFTHYLNEEPISYVGSLINSYCLNVVIKSMLPNDLSNQLRTVAKGTRIPSDVTFMKPWTDYTIDTELFLIAYSEATIDLPGNVHPEGEMYDYYKGESPIYEKADLKGNGQSYWTRTAYEGAASFYICSSTGWGSTQIVNQAAAVAPMFCI